MGNVLVSLDEKHEALLRQLAQEKYGSKKGSVSAVVKEALDKVASETNAAAKEMFIKKLKEGKFFKYKMYKGRNEIYD